MHLVTFECAIKNLDHSKRALASEACVHGRQANVAIVKMSIKASESSTPHLIKPVQQVIFIATTKVAEEQLGTLN